MGDPEDKDDKHADDLARLPSLFKEWQGLVVVLGGAVAAVLAVLLPGQTPAAVQVIGYTVAVALVVVGALIFVRVRRRQRARRLREKRREKWEREAAGAHRTAFRGLFPFQEGDELPGEHRQLEARRLVTQFGEPTFSFSVVCGDSGCGKTSLLRSAIQSRLKAVGEEKGFGVLYLSSPRELADDGSQHADATDIASRLRREMEGLRRLAEDAARGRSLILIVDQFEEFFTEYNSPELRLEIGRFLNDLIKSSPPVRVLCAIRRDYLADMKDLAPADLDAAGNFFEPLSHQGLFKLTNFTVQQATQVIRECAERDRIVLDEEFTKTLASDLSNGDFVRPPELQIVCTALGSDPTLAGYRLAGGARGILSHHIEDAIELCGDPDTGRRVLRDLCDFPAHAKRNPQTVAEIAEAISAQGPQAQAHINTALKRFQGARLVVSERRGDEKAKNRAGEEPAYALVHDYLVDAVSQATRDVMTRDEEANQLLDYYVSEYRTDPKTRIPFHRLRFIRRRADPKKLSDPTAHRLLRVSITRLVTSTAALATLVVITTALLVALTTTRRVWHQEVLGSYWNKNDYFQSLEWVVQPKRGLIFVGISDRGEGYNKVDVWNVKTASLMYSFQHEHLNYVPPDYILGYSKDNSVVTALHLPTMQEVQTAIPTKFMKGEGRAPFNPDKEVFFSSSGTTIAIRENEWLLSSEEIRRRSPPPVGVFSIPDNTSIGDMLTCHGEGRGSRPNFYLTDDGNHFLGMCNEGEVRKPTVFNLRTKEKRVLVRAGFKPVDSFAFNDKSFPKAASLETSRDARLYLVLHDLRTGEILGAPSEVSLEVDQKDKIYSDVSFTPDGEYIYVRNRVLMSDNGDVNKNFLTLFRTNGLRRVTTVPERDFRVIEAANHGSDSNGNDHIMVTWPNSSGGTYLWDLAEAEPRLLANLTLPEYYGIDVSLSTTGTRAILTTREKEQVELWDFKAGKKLRGLDIPGRFKKLEFTIGGNAVSVNVEGGTVSLFRADNGEQITDEIRNIGGTKQAIYYDERCRRVHVWTDEGRVLRYTYGWYIFGRESWFWPADRCEAQ